VAKNFSRRQSKRSIISFFFFFCYFLLLFIRFVPLLLLLVLLLPSLFAFFFFFWLFLFSYANKWICRSATKEEEEDNPIKEFGEEWWGSLDFEIFHPCE
jgi:predicted ABC-type exoprotein transport system permease subunit